MRFKKSEMNRNLESGFPVLWKAVTAIDGSALGGLEGNFTFFSAV
jgi:hypothetical protein